MTAIALHSRAFQQDKLPFFEQLLSKLGQNKVHVILHEALARFLSQADHRFSAYCQNTFSQSEDLKNIDYIFSVGGDGTLLETATFVKAQKIPVLGINAGRLGFLATTTLETVNSAIDALLQGQYTIDYRTLIQLESDREVFNGINFGLNEFTIFKRDTSSMIVVHTYLNKEYLNSYWADGLIIATPTGSTGYSLSAGGPVVVPNTNNFIISPVSPHNLNVRPMVVSDDSIISFKIEGRSKNFLISLDSRSQKVDATINMQVRKCDFKIGLVKFKESNFFNTLRLKLNWGLDARN